MYVLLFKKKKKFGQKNFLYFFKKYIYYLEACLKNCIFWEETDSFKKHFLKLTDVSKKHLKKNNWFLETKSIFWNWLMFEKAFKKITDFSKKNIFWKVNDSMKEAFFEK